MSKIKDHQRIVLMFKRQDLNYVGSI